MPTSAGPNPAQRVFAFHHQSVARLNATPEIAFPVLDDFKSLSAHMGKRSLMMLGSAMSIDMDALGGRAPGSRVTMQGRVLGIRLSLQEVVIQRDPPFRKVWQTTRVHLLAIGHYRLGFTLSPERSGSRLQVFIDYDLPSEMPPLLARLPAGIYARWCVGRIARDAAGRFPAGVA